MGASVEVVNIEGGKVGAVELPDFLFNSQVHEYALHSAVVAYETHQRQGNASTKKPLGSQPKRPQTPPAKGDRSGSAGDGGHQFASRWGPCVRSQAASLLIKTHKAVEEESPFLRSVGKKPEGKTQSRPGLRVSRAEHQVLLRHSEIDWT